MYMSVCLSSVILLFCHSIVYSIFLSLWINLSVCLLFYCSIYYSVYNNTIMHLHDHLSLRSKPEVFKRFFFFFLKVSSSQEVKCDLKLLIFQFVYIAYVHMIIFIIVSLYTCIVKIVFLHPVRYLSSNSEFLKGVLSSILSGTESCCDVSAHKNAVKSVPDFARVR